MQAGSMTGGHGFEGTASLVRLGLRRDRILLPAWISLLVLTVVGSAVAVKDLYPTEADRIAAANAVNGSAALVAMFGRIYDPTSLGAIAMVKMTSFGGAAAAIIAAMITIRHSRSEEEAGRIELLGAAVVGRQAPLTAALAVATIASVVLGVLTALGLMAAGLPVAGSLAFGAAWSGAGMAFAGAAGIAAQLARTSRGATGVAIGFLGFSYILRAIGDTSVRLSFLIWVSPLGWVHRVQAFAGNRWWVLILLLGFAAVSTAGSFALSSRRDLGAGLLPDRPGPAAAGRGLGGTIGLAWRLERGALLAWTSAFALLGLVVGGVAGNVESFLNSPNAQDLIRRLGGQKGIVDAYFAAEFGVVGVVIAAYGVHAALRLRTEEDAQRTEEVLATAVSRQRWAASYVLVALAGSTLLALTVGVTAGAARTVQTGELSDFFALVAGALVQLPAVWVVVSIVAAAYGIGSRFAVTGWVALVVFLLLGEIGPLLRLPSSIIEFSPFAHVPKLPGSEFNGVPLLVLVGIAALMTAAGVAGFRRRDLA